MSATALAIDLGSSGGRVVAGILRGSCIDQIEIHRFAHEAQLRDGYLVWDVDEMLRQIEVGLRRGLDRFPDAATVSVDTWGVDWAALDDDARLVVMPRAYRDERTVRTLDAFRARLGDDEVWQRTAIAPATINTANQLFAYLSEEPEAAARTSRVLMLPDYFTYRLSGIEGWSRSIASTGALCRPGANEWADDVFEALGIPRGWVGDLTDELTIVGPCTLNGLENLSVVRAGAHDSACAVHAMITSPDADTYFLSCGSWSVLGVVRDVALTSITSRDLGVTNEARADRGVRPLFNITGLWILQECQRAWQAEGLPSGIVELLGAASREPSLGITIDVDDATFAHPGQMVERIERAVGRRGLTQGQIVRIICESLAVRYARGVADLESVAGSRATGLTMVSGGSRNSMLCQLTADAIGLPVTAGPAEASVLGSLLAQFEITGELVASDRNPVIRDSAQTVTYVPSHA